VIETLDALAREGTHMAVLSNKPQALCDQLLAALGMAKYFRAIHGAGRYSYSKPDARVYHHVVDEIGGPEKSLMIGDSATDVVTARAANVPVIVLTYGYTPIPARELGGDRVTDNFRDVPRMARELFGG
jgi:phosphoglycolate phosphatase